MKLNDITIEDIYNYLEIHSNFKIELSDNGNGSKIIDLYFYDMISKSNIFMCSIYKNNKNDFTIKTFSLVAPFRFGNRIFDINNVELEEVVCVLFNLIKACIYQNIEDEKLGIAWLDNFCMNNKLELSSIATLNNQIYESRV